MPGDAFEVTVARGGRAAARWAVEAPMGPRQVAAFRARVGGADGLRPAADLPVRARRLLTAFQHEPGGPVGWLPSGRAVRWPEGGAVGGVDGTVREVTPVSDGFVLAVGVGRRVRAFAVDAWSPPTSAEEAVLGAATTGRLFPPQHRPPGLVGRAVRVAEGGDGVTPWL